MKLLALVTAIVTIAGAIPALAQQEPPAARIYGSIMINGVNAPNGTIVTAYSGVVLCGTSSGDGLYNGTQYFVDIDRSQMACATPGNTLNFKVNGQSANESTQVPQILGSPVRLDLSVTRAQPSTAPPITARATPETPTNLQASVLNSSTARLDWNRGGGESGFAIYDGYSGQYVAYPSSNSFTLNGLTPNSNYCAIVIAWNSIGWSGWSNWTCFTTPP